MRNETLQQQLNQLQYEMRGTIRALEHTIVAAKERICDHMRSRSMGADAIKQFSFDMGAGYNMAQAYGAYDVAISIRRATDKIGEDWNLAMDCIDEAMNQLDAYREELA